MKMGLIVGLVISCFVTMLILFLWMLDLPTLFLYIIIPILIFGGLVAIFSLPFLVMKSNHQISTMRS